MNIKMSCSSCGSKLKVPHEYSGRRGACPNCKMIMKIPSTDTLDFDNSCEDKAFADALEDELAEVWGSSEPKLVTGKPKPAPSKPRQAPTPTTTGPTGRASSRYQPPGATTQGTPVVPAPKPTPVPSIAPVSNVPQKPQPPEVHWLPWFLFSTVGIIVILL